MNDRTPTGLLSSLYHRVRDYIVGVLPEIDSPKRPIPLQKKLKWSGVVLVIYLILGEIPIYGMAQEAQDYFSFVKAVLASESGTLVTLGIGPVVTAGIFMQLFQGAEIFHFDLGSHEGRARFQETQKMLAVFLCFFEAALFVFAGAFGDFGLAREIFLIVQVGLGALLVVLLDEIVTKWGFGSGISLFIVGGVAKDVFWKLFSFETAAEYGGEYIGAIPGFLKSAAEGSVVWLRSGLPDMTEVFFTILIFLLVVYFESLWVEVPLSLGRFRGVRGGYPLKFIYASVVPVIFTMASFGTLGLIARTIESRFSTGILGVYDYRGNTIGGLMYYLTPPRGILRVVADPSRAIIYLIIVVALCPLFAILWTNITGMDSKSVAQRMQTAGVQVAGFQRDIRVIETILDKHIPQVTILGGIAVGLLAAVANFTSALGTGTGILLAVSITYRAYLDLRRDPELPDRIRRIIT